MGVQPLDRLGGPDGRPVSAVGAYWLEVDGVRVGGDSLLGVEFATSGGELSTVTARFEVSSFETADHDEPEVGTETADLIGLVDGLVLLEQAPEVEAPEVEA